VLVHLSRVDAGNADDDSGELRCWVDDNWKKVVSQRAAWAMVSTANCCLMMEDALFKLDYSEQFYPDQSFARF
jgi:hypothetical protein